MSDSFSKDSELFIKDAIKIHGEKYDYSQTDYKRSWDKVVIGCPIHGQFTQQANSHLQGQGCPSCSVYGYDTCKPAALYVLKLGDDFLKFGISNDFNRRFRELRKHCNYVVEVLYVFNYNTGSEAKLVEDRIKNTLKQLGVLSKNEISNGFTETTYLENLEIILNTVNSFTNTA